MAKVWILGPFGAAVRARGQMVSNAKNKYFNRLSDLVELDALQLGHSRNDFKWTEPGKWAAIWFAQG